MSRLSRVASIRISYQKRICFAHVVIAHKAALTWQKPILRLPNEVHRIQRVGISVEPFCSRSKINLRNPSPNWPRLSESIQNSRCPTSGQRLMWQLVRNRQRCQAQFRRQFFLPRPRRVVQVQRKSRGRYASALLVFPKTFRLLAETESAAQISS